MGKLLSNANRVTQVTTRIEPRRSFLATALRERGCTRHANESGVTGGSEVVGPRRPDLRRGRSPFMRLFCVHYVFCLRFHVPCVMKTLVPPLSLSVA